MRFIKRGSRGAAVEKWQRFLVAQGLDPKGVDGRFGPGTESATKWFQKRAGLKADGLVGNRTWKAAEAASRPKPPPPAKMKKGRTTAALNLRQGAGTGSAVIAVLPAGARVDIVSTRGSWREVISGGKRGWVYGKYVVLDAHKVAEGFLKDSVDIAAIALEPMAKAAGTSGVARSWNRYGGLLGHLSGKLAIEPETAAAVLAVESRGDGFAADGRMIIRLENHWFYNKWGAKNTAKYDAHFTPRKGWRNHKWRPTASGRWQSVHTNQSANWAAFEFASKLNSSAAKLAISMGLPQVMGFNYGRIGYESVAQMYDAFKSGNGVQILGFFDFVQGPSARPHTLQSLQRKDFYGFAHDYNGASNVQAYGDKMKAAYDQLKRAL